MFTNGYIYAYSSGNPGPRSNPMALPSFIMQKNKNRHRIKIITAVISIILCLGLKIYSVNIPDHGTVSLQSPEFNLVIQVGAFTKETNATVFREKLAALIDKPVIIVNEEGFYKVRLTGFKTIEDIEKIIPALGLIGIKDFWVPRVRKDTITAGISVLKPDTTRKNPEEKYKDPKVAAEPDSPAIEETPDLTETTYALEIGSYRKQNRALNAQREVISKLNLPVEIVSQWNSYHVIITGFKDKAEINKYIPELARMHFNEISVINNYTK